MNKKCKFLVLPLLICTTLIKTAEMAPQPAAAAAAASAPAPVIFDENFGYSEKVLESGPYSGKRFKDVKSELLNPQVLDPQQTCSMPAICASMMEGSMDLYTNKINPDCAASKYFKRAKSIDVSRDILEGAGLEQPEPTKKEWYYVATGQILSNDNALQLWDKAFQAWCTGQMTENYNVINACTPIFFLDSLEKILLKDSTKSKEFIDAIFKVIKFSRDIKAFEQTKPDFTTWKASLPVEYLKFLNEDAALRCYYTYLYNHSILTSDEARELLSNEDIDALGIQEESSCNTCPYAKYSGHNRKGYREPVGNEVFKKLFGEIEQ